MASMKENVPQKLRRRGQRLSLRAQLKTAVARSFNAKIAKKAKGAAGTWRSIAQRSWAPTGVAIVVGAQLCCAMSGVASAFGVTRIFLMIAAFSSFSAYFALTAVLEIKHEAHAVLGVAQRLLPRL
jgi:hypothetical protein